MPKPVQITILGGGPAGLAAGYYAKKNTLPFVIFEASNLTGGHCVTLRNQDFYYDSGAHRFHDQDAEATAEIKHLLKNDLTKIRVPSQIFYQGKLIDFPLSPLNLTQNLGLYASARAALELVGSRCKGKAAEETFESFALFTYGKTIANQFLLNYSEKLWGVRCSQLSTSVCGKRLKGLNLKTFLMEMFLGRTAKIEHLDGSFYYPKMGIGTIPEKLENFCGVKNIQKNSKITKIFHNQRQIKAIEVNQAEKLEVNEVISTLPLQVFLELMEPAPSEEILLASRSLRHRNLILVAFFLDKNSVTENASVYFPEKDFPFTRVYEPKNRSVHMSPPGKTSLVTEIPCQREDEVWQMADSQLVQLVSSHLIKIGWLKADEIIDASVIKLSRAYPVLEVGYEEKVHKLVNYLKGFNNLKLSGRNGKFMYTHLHDMLRYGKEVIDEYVPLQAIR